MSEDGLSMTEKGKVITAKMEASAAAAAIRAALLPEDRDG